jgi:hypothetical protein
VSAKVHVTGEFFVQACGLPRDTRVVGCQYDANINAFTLDVEHHSIPEGVDEVRVICQSVACHFEPVKKP